MRLRLGTRASTLAVTQSTHVADALRALGHEVELVRITTRGDKMRGSLLALAGLGVFAAELRSALLDGKCDFAVHSLKDLPVERVPGLVIAAIPEREDPRDALCARDDLQLMSLPMNARVGTGSPRRIAQLRGLRPDLEYVDIRGNIETRLSRVAPGDLDAVVLAAAGLNRLGLHGRITELLDILPSPGQGALALECRHGDRQVREALLALEDEDTRIAVTAERELLRALGGGCAAPIGALGAPAMSAGSNESSSRTVGAGQPSSDLSAGPSRLTSHHARGGEDTDAFFHPRSLSARGEDAAFHPRSLSARDEVAGVSKGDRHPDKPHLTGGVFALDGSRHLILSVSLSTPEAAGQWIAQELVMRGAAEICDITASRDSRLDEFHDDGLENSQQDILRDIQQDVHAGRDLWPRGHELRNTRIFLPREEGDLSAAIEAAGPQVVCEPLIRRRALTPTGSLEGADWVAVTSARTVDTLADLGWRIPDDARIAAVGRATARALEDAGYTVELVPEGPSSAADLLEAWPDGSGRVVIPGSDLSSPELVDGLRDKGYDAVALPIYTVDPVVAPSPYLSSGWHHGQFDAVIVTSGSVARAINDLLGWPSGIRVLAFGHPTAAVLADLDVAAAVSPAQDPASVVRALTDLLTKGQA